MPIKKNIIKAKIVRKKNNSNKLKNSLNELISLSKEGTILDEKLIRRTAKRHQVDPEKLLKETIKTVKKLGKQKKTKRRITAIELMRNL